MFIHQPRTADLTVSVTLRAAYMLLLLLMYRALQLSCQTALVVGVSVIKCALLHNSRFLNLHIVHKIADCIVSAHSSLYSHACDVF